MKFIHVQNPAEGIARLTLNNPEFRNTIHPEMYAELDHALDMIEKDQTVRIAIINGNGKSFSAGLDLPAFIKKYPFVKMKDEGSKAQIQTLIENMQKTFLKIQQGRKVYIASMHKHVYGAALDLVTFCDIRIAADNARFSIAETSLGIVADLGSLNNLPPLIGESRTRYLALTGEIINAEAALNSGLLTRVTPPETLADETMKIALNLAAKPGNILQNLKYAMNQLRGKSLTEGLDYLAEYNAELLPDSEFIRNMAD